MDQQPNYRRRRLGVMIAALSLLAVANHDRPTFGVLSIDVDGDHVPQVSAELAPALDAVALAVAAVAREIAARP